MFRVRTLLILLLGSGLGGLPEARANLTIADTARLTVVGKLYVDGNDLVVETGGILRVNSGSVTRASVIEVQPLARLVGCGTLEAILLNRGTVIVDCGSAAGLELTQSVSNQGDFVLKNRSGFISTGGVFTNNGSLDMRFGDEDAGLPTDFVDNGRILEFGSTESLARILDLFLDGPDATVVADTSLAFEYYLQSSFGLESWTDVSEIRPGGGEISFTHSGGASGADRRFYRLVEQ